MSKDDKKESVVNIDKSKYTDTRAASGAKSLNNGDVVAVALVAMTAEECFSIGDVFLETDYREQYKMTSKGKPMNGGMQRMNLGSRFRGHIAEINREIVKARAAAEKAEKTFKEPKTGEERFAKAVAPFIKVRDKRVAEETKAKEKAAAEAVKAKEAKAKEKADAKAKRAADATAKAEAKAKAKKKAA